MNGAVDPSIEQAVKDAQTVYDKAKATVDEAQKNVDAIQLKVDAYKDSDKAIADAQKKLDDAKKALEDAQAAKDKADKTLAIRTLRPTATTASWIRPTATATPTTLMRTPQVVINSPKPEPAMRRHSPSQRS